MLEDIPGRKYESRFSGPAYELNGENAVTAEMEEVLIGAHLLKRKQLCEQAAERQLLGCSGRVCFRAAVAADRFCPLLLPPASLMRSRVTILMTQVIVDLASRRRSRTAANVSSVPSIPGAICG